MLRSSISLPDGDEAELIEEPRRANPGVPVLALTKGLDPAEHARAT
jgi:DNA-binding NarL/FixJ family response regulator